VACKRIGIPPRPRRDPEVRNEKWETVLHGAVNERPMTTSTLRQHEIVRLLAHKADSNTQDDQCVSCFDKAMHDTELAVNLIQGGAIVSVATLIAALRSLDVEIVRSILETGVDPNGYIERPPPKNLEATYRRNSERKTYSLHLASSASFRSTQAIEIINLLLNTVQTPGPRFLKLNSKQQYCTTLSDTEV